MSPVKGVILFWVLLSCLSGPVWSHEMDSAHWRLVQQDALHWQSLLQLPEDSSGRVVPLTPVLPEGCESLDDVQTSPAREEGIRVRWTIHCQTTLSQVGLTGFSLALPDAYVEVLSRDGVTQHGVLNNSRSSLEIGPGASDLPRAHYFGLGVHHILLGPDHLLFVAGLFVLWWRRQESALRLLGTITAFTLAHSLTLGAAATGWVKLPMDGVEAVIALSVLLLAYELVVDNRDSLIHRHLPAVAFTFGLIHGFGFADALQATGLPADAWLWSLALFNLGVEAGQLLLVAVLLFIPGIMQWFPVKGLLVRLAPLGLCVYGGLAAWWTLERSWLVLA